MVTDGVAGKGATLYEIADEPRPGKWTHLSSNPFWMFLATMLGGVWIGWTWFAVNSVAIGSATRRREFSLIGVGLLGSALLVLLGGYLVEAGVLHVDHLGYAATLLIVWKLGISYRLHLWQSQSFELYQYFGGPTKNGALLMLAGMFLRSVVLGAFGSTFLSLVLG